MSNTSAFVIPPFSCKKKFSFLKKQCADGSTVWLKPYYIVYRVKVLGIPFQSYASGIKFRRTFVENITEEEYLVRKLIGTL